MIFLRQFSPLARNTANMVEDGLFVRCPASWVMTVNWFGPRLLQGHSCMHRARQGSNLHGSLAISAISRAARWVFINQGLNFLCTRGFQSSTSSFSVIIASFKVDFMTYFVLFHTFWNRAKAQLLWLSCFLFIELLWVCSVAAIFILDRVLTWKKQ